MTLTELYVILVASIIFVACTGLIAVSAIAFAKAITAAHAARLHAYQAAASERTFESAEEALRGAPSAPSRNGYRRPTKEELIEGIRLAREDANDDEPGDADANAGYEDDAAQVGGSGGMYQQGGY